MNSMTSKGTSHKSLMEAIALLYMINQCPESPRDNQPPQSLTSLSASYQLPLQREKEIVDNLAFLSATTNDSTRVMAVCLEEDRGRDSCTIRLTSNTGDLHEVVNGFNHMARILERAASRANSRDDDTKALFRCIVVLDYFRILSRLRSKHAKKNFRKKDKPVLITLLHTTIHDRSIRPSSSITKIELENLRTKVNALSALFWRLEGIPNHSAKSVEVQDTIMDLIIQMYELGSQTKLKSILESSLILESGIKEFLPVAVGKIGRYYSISYELVCAARSKEYSIFQNVMIRTSPIRRPSQPSNTDSSIHPLTALQNVFRPKTAAELRTFQQSLESILKKSIQDISDEFRAIIIDYYRFVKVHAEIQLLFFYEQNPRRPRPRVICSSKSACYLCDLFFKLHGQFYLPRTHGRLYHKWTLPEWRTIVPEMRRLGFNALLMRFRDALKFGIRIALENGPVRVHHPNESVLIMPAHWSSSTITRQIPSILEPVSTTRLAQTQEDLPEVLDNIRSGVPALTSLTSLTRPDLPLSGSLPQAELLTIAASSTSTSISTIHPPAQELLIPTEIPTSDTVIPPRTTSPYVCPSRSPISYCDLTQGETIWQLIAYPNTTNTTISIGTTRLHLHLSCDVGPPSTSNIAASSSCWVQVKRLQSTEFETSKAKSQVVNVDDLLYDTGITVEYGAAYTPTELYLRQGEDFLSIKYSFERPR